MLAAHEYLPVDSYRGLPPVVLTVIAWTHQLVNIEPPTLDPKGVCIVNAVVHHAPRVCRVNSDSVITADQA
jgi:hypothetical protein